jgi:hypothetical protein
MRTVYGFTFGVIITLLGISHLLPTQTHTQYVPEVQVIERTVIDQVITTIDLDRIRNTEHLDPHLDEQLAYQCALTIQRQTDEPLAGITLYISRYWNDDACTAAEHLMVYGWY